jgi:hypothetical protein
MLIALAVVFSKDISQWADRLENPAVQNAMLPVAHAAERASETLGVQAASKAAQGAIWPVYANSPKLAERGVSTPASSLPTSEVAANIAVETPQPEVQVEASIAPPPAEVLVNANQGFAPKRILIVGASSIQEGLGTEIERQLKAFKGVEVKRFGQYSTGLCRPDYFDWPKKLKELKTEFKPDLIIAQWGENDCQGMGNLDGSFHSKFGTDEWDKEYARRVTELVKYMETDGGHSAMIGIPIMRSKKMSQQVERLNGVTKKATEASGGLYVDTWKITADGEGKYRGSATIDGKEKMIRAGDGIHLSTYGAEFVAAGIIADLSKTFVFEKK